MEFLIEYGPGQLYWDPAEVFLKLSCVQLMLQLISIACNWKTYYARWENDGVVWHRFVTCRSPVASHGALVLCNPRAWSTSFLPGRAVSVLVYGVFICWGCFIGIQVICLLSSTRNDTVRYALDVLAILTVVPKIQLQLAEAVDTVDEGGTSISIVGMYSPASAFASSVIYWNLQ